MISSGRTVRVIVGRRPGPTVNRMSTLNSLNSTFNGLMPALITVPRLPRGTRDRNPRDRVASTRSPR